MDSWKNQYLDVEDLPLERDRMLPSSSSSSQPMASPPKRNSRSFASSPLNPQPTPSSSLSGRPSSSSGGSHHHHHTHTRQGSSSKPLPRSPSAQQLQYPPPAATSSSMAASSSMSPSASASASSSTSPLPPPIPTSPFGRPGSRGSFNLTPRSPSTVGLPPFAPGTPTSDLLAAHHSFAGGAAGTVGSRGSMILYRRADSQVFSGGGGGSGTATPVQVPSHTGVSGMSAQSEEAPSQAGLLPPPNLFASMTNRASVYSTMTSGDSIYGVERGLVAYAYDPDEDDESDDEDGDWLHDPEVAYPGSPTSSKGKGKPLPKDPTRQKITDPTHPLYIPKPYIAPRITWRGFVNIGMLVALVASLLCLFVVYPMVRFYADDEIKGLITGNLRINSTGQAEYFPDEEPVNEDGTTPTTTSRPRTTVTSINEGGNIFNRRVMWRRETDEWALEFPVPSYNLNYLTEPQAEEDAEVKEQVKQVEEEKQEEKARVAQMFDICLQALPMPLVVNVLFEVGYDSGEKGKKVVEGVYEDGKWSFDRSSALPSSPSPSSAEETEEDDDDDDSWILVKKSTPKKLFAVRLRDYPPFHPDALPVQIRRVALSSGEGEVGAWGWKDAPWKGCEGEYGMEEEVVDVRVGDVLAVASS